MNRSIRVALDVPLRIGDAAFTFSAGAAPDARRGDGVVVPFGRRLVPGIVLGDDTWRPDLRPVLAALPGGPLVPPATVDLAERVAGEYLSSIGEALAVAVPWDALWAGIRLQPAGPRPPGALAAALEPMSRRPASLARASRLLRPAWDALEEIARGRLLTCVSREEPGSASPDVPAPAPARAAGAQVGGGPAGPRAAGPRSVESAVGDALAGGQRGLLLAGWHRTPAYLAAIHRAGAAGWSAAAIFPSVETARIFADAARMSGLEPIVLHGELDPTQRLAAWRAAISARAALVAGTRSAIFAPVSDPVLAIVDDEDNSGHKEERAPRYLTRSVAAARTATSGILIAGSTTPTVGSYADAQAGRLRLIALPSPRPRVGVIDLRRRPDPDQPISRPVMDAVRRAARRRGRALVLVDRKGYAALQCQECGAVERCPQCGVAMRYDRERRRLRCRFCGRSEAAPAACTRCRGMRFAPLGAGTERIAAVLRRLAANVWRLDRDTLPPGHDIAAILGPFRERGGVLVATPLVVPWIEMLQPDLIAILGADRWLHRPEFRAAERALALFRAIGSATRTPVLVETADPTHPAIQAAQATSLRPFYAEELALREALGYPPARSLVVVTVTAKAAAAAQAVAADLAGRATAGVEVLGPVALPGAPGRSEIVLKAADRAAARALVYPLLTGKGLPRGAQTAVDVDPIELQ